MLEPHIEYVQKGENWEALQYIKKRNIRLEEGRQAQAVPAARLLSS
jgi:hypothetical protein